MPLPTSTSLWYYWRYREARTSKCRRALGGPVGLSNMCTYGIHVACRNCICISVQIPAVYCLCGFPRKGAVTSTGLQRESFCFVRDTGTRRSYSSQVRKGLGEECGKQKQDRIEVLHILVCFVTKVPEFQFQHTEGYFNAQKGSV